jgi:hypothetical protein
MPVLWFSILTRRSFIAPVVIPRKFLDWQAGAEYNKPALPGIYWRKKLRTLKQLLRLLLIFILLIVKRDCRKGGPAAAVFMLQICIFAFA